MLCYPFQALAERTWTRMQRSNLTGIRLREDGITALNLQDLYDLNPRELLIFDFSPFEESTESGADWEWWFAQPGAFFGAAVQAKCLQTDRYDFGYTPKNGVPQIDRLFQYARKHEVSPQYCLYNYWAAPTQASRRLCCGSIHERLWGCAIADAQAIWDVHKLRRDRLHDVLPLCRPWHCIVCCPPAAFSSRQGLAVRAAATADEVWEEGKRVAAQYRERRRRGRTRAARPRLHERPPERIRQLARLSFQRGAVPAELALELWDGLPPRRVVVQGDIEAAT